MQMKILRMISRDASADPDVGVPALRVRKLARSETVIQKTAQTAQTASL